MKQNTNGECDAEKRRITGKAGRRRDRFWNTIRVARGTKLELIRQQAGQASITAGGGGVVVNPFTGGNSFQILFRFASTVVKVCRHGLRGDETKN